MAADRRRNDAPFVGRCAINHWGVVVERGAVPKRQFEANLAIGWGIAPALNTPPLVQGEAPTRYGMILA